MFDLIFDPPWWLPVGIVVVGGYLFWAGNRKQDNTLRNVGLGALAVALLVMVVAYFVDTARESAIEKTQQIVKAVDKRDWTAFSALLDNKTSMLIYRGKQQLTDGARRTTDRIGLKSVRLLSTEAVQNDSRITVDIGCLSEQEAMPYPQPTNWRFTWQNSGDGWYLGSIEYISNANLPVDRLRGQLVAPAQ